MQDTQDIMTCASILETTVFFDTRESQIQKFQWSTYFVKTALFLQKSMCGYVSIKVLKEFFLYMDKSQYMVKKVLFGSPNLWMPL